MLFKNVCGLANFRRHSITYSYICNYHLHTINNSNKHNLLMVAKKQNDKVKSEEVTVNSLIKTKSTSSKGKKAVKKEPKSLKQPKLDFTPSTPAPKNWAKYPPIDVDEDLDTEFKRIEGIRKKCGVYIGAHVSASGGPEFAVENSYNVLGQSIALFLKNQRTWYSKELTRGNIENFKNYVKKYNYDLKFVLPHASFLINMANPEPEKRNRSFDNFVDDLHRCEQLGITLFNFHPGSTCGLCEKSEGIKNIYDCVNKALSMTKGVTIVLENSSGQKNVIGSKFEDLKQIIDNVKDKSRIGVCLDTCHLFAAGYDIRTREKFDEVMKEFDNVVGLKYLKAVHLNDSKSDLGSALDRHENIGKGKLTEETFRFIVNSEYFKNIPVILETPIAGDESVYKQEVKLMYSLYEGK